MKLLTLVLLCIANTVFSQTDSEVFLLELSSENESFTVSNIQNISNNLGYDSQPYFFDNETLLYARTENGQTEINTYSSTKNKTRRLNIPTAGGEYSPQKFPETNQVAAVRLDTSGLQRLYRYEYSEMNETKSALLLPETEVAYFAFHDNNNIIASVLGGDQLNLVIGNLKTKEVIQYIENSGRSIHKVPESKSVSYTLVNEEKNNDIYLLDIDEKEKESFFVCQLPIGIQDYCWLSPSKLLLGSGSKLYVYDLFGKQEWAEVADLSTYGIKDISRITVSENGTKIALVSEVAMLGPSDIVDAHLEPFNNRELEKLASAFSENVIVGLYQKDTTTVGKESLKSGYEKFYKRIKNSHIEVLNRITVGDYVIDYELAITNGEEEKQAAVYSTKDGLIASMFFIPDAKTKQDPVIVVDRQLKGYNDRDINAFAATYSDDIVLMSYPNTITSAGLETLKKGYGPFFQNTPDLHCKITNRIVIGNKVIDLEEVVMNGKIINAVAIYEVENGKISKVTFLR